MRQEKFHNLSIKMQRFKKLSMPCGAIAAAAAAVPLLTAAQPIKDEQQEKKLIRPSQLPIYMSDEACPRPSSRGEECPPSIMEESFGTIRRSFQGLLSEYSSVTDNFNSKISTGYEHSLLMLDYLREESNIMPRLGAVGIGGLTGLVLSLRGGKFKRLMYTSGGALSVAAVCYPKQAQDTFTLAKHYTNIGYNFVYGVKPGDANQLEIKWPEIPKIQVPSSASEFFNLALDTGSSLASAVASLLGKDTGSPISSKTITDATAAAAAAETKPKDK